MKYTYRLKQFQAESAYQLFIRIAIYFSGVMKVLLVEDNQRLARLTSEGLRLHGLIVEQAASLEQAEYLLRIDSFDAIILDRMLPGGRDGLDLCTHLRQTGRGIPIIMLTALSDVSERVKGLKQGADDYLVKPFKLEELIARLKVIVRRNTSDTTPIIVRSDDLEIHLGTQQVFVAKNEVNLSRRLWDVLEFMALHQGHVMSKEMLIERVWGIDRDVLHNTVEAAIKQLRHRLHNTTAIETVYGFGYRLKKSTHHDQPG